MGNMLLKTQRINCPCPFIALFQGRTPGVSIIMPLARTQQRPSPCHPSALRITFGSRSPHLRGIAVAVSVVGLPDAHHRVHHAQCRHPSNTRPHRGGVSAAQGPPCTWARAVGEAASATADKPPLVQASGRRGGSACSNCADQQRLEALYPRHTCLHAFEFPIRTPDEAR